MTFPKVLKASNVGVRGPGPVLSRFDRFLLIGPRAKRGPALRLLSNSNLHFPSELLVCSAGAGPSVFEVI